MPVQWVAIRSLNVTSSHVQFKIFMSWLKNLRKIMFWISISNIKNIQLKIYQIRVFFFWGWVLLKSHPLCESRFQPGTIKIRITIASQTTLLSTHLSQSVANTTNLSIRTNIIFGHKLMATTFASWLSLALLFCAHDSKSQSGLLMILWSRGREHFNFFSSQSMSFNIKVPSPDAMLLCLWIQLAGKDILRSRYIYQGEDLSKGFDMRTY